MKRIAALLGTALLASGSAMANDIDSPWCIDFVNFCDGLLLSPMGDGTMAAEWRNNDCAGGTSTAYGVMRDGILTVACTDQSQCPGGLVWKFNFDTATNVFDMFGYDRVNPPFPQQVNQPFRIGRGTCPFGEGGTPSTLSR
jgi:hypothetical protein